MVRRSPSHNDLDRGPGGWDGGPRSWFGRVVGDVDNPLGWAITLGRLWGVRVRVHLFFLIYAGVTVLFSILKHEMGWGYTVGAMAALFLLVLAHEFGHCFAARWVGGEADDILMWPLGGLASLHLPERWRAHMIATVGGPAVHVALLPIIIGAMLAAGLREAVVFHPLRLSATLGSPVFDAWWKVMLFWLHVTNLALLAFNVLLPIFPMDGGRILRAALWARVGARRATEIAVNIGLAGACILGVGGLAAQQSTLVGVAVFGGLVCWTERKRLRAPEALGGGFDVGIDDAGVDALERDAREAEREARAEEKRRERERSRQAEVDRILAKIAKEGMGSLSRAEREALSAETERKRRV